jgi:hypothetical protein
VSALAALVIAAALEPEGVGTPPSVPRDSHAEQAPAPGGDEWPLESRRVHAGAGLRLHGGIMGAHGFPFWQLQMEIVGVLSILLAPHDELRAQLGVWAGFPDTGGGELNVGFVHALDRRVSLGVAGLVDLGVWGLRGGVEVPFILHLGSARRHQVILSGRVLAGTFNATPLTGWTLANQRWAVAADLSAGYVFLF